MDDIERTLLVKPEVFVYKIPPRASARGYRAADWNLTAPDWTGRLRCLVKGKDCTLRLEDKGSGELFAACPVASYPGTAVEAVTDSSRYFVICIQDSGRKAYIGIGFSDRADSFDLNVTLQDHFKMLRKEDAFSKEAEEPAKPSLDLAFKAGQTIRINIPNKDGTGDQGAGATARPKKAAGGAGGILPPPPGGIKLGPPPGAANLTPLQSPSEPNSKPVIGSTAAAAPAQSSTDLLGDLLGGGGAPLAAAPAAVVAPAAAAAATTDDPWGDFASAPSNQVASSGNWTQF